MGQSGSTETGGFVIPNFNKICPGSYPIAGLDWFEPTDSPGIGFTVCQTCYDSAIQPTGYGAHYWAQAKNINPNQQYKCQFSRWWIRVAWMKMVNDKPQRTEILKEIFKTPLGTPICARNEVFSRRWLSFQDPESGRPMPGITGCWYCMTCLTKIFPELKEHLITISNRVTRNTCDFMPPNEMASKVVPNLVYYMMQFYGGGITIEDVLKALKNRGIQNNKTIPPDQPQSGLVQGDRSAPSSPHATASEQRLTNSMASMNLNGNKTSAPTPSAPYSTQKSTTVTPPSASGQNPSSPQSTSEPMALAENFKKSAEEIVNQPGPFLSTNQAMQPNETPSASMTTWPSGCPRSDKAKMAWHFYIGENALDYHPISCCSSCFNTIIKPEIAAGKPLAKKWTEETREAEFFCYLGTPRLRGKWAAALSSGDEKEFMDFIQARTNKNIELTKHIAELGTSKKIQEMQVQYNNQMAAMKMMASAGSVLGGGGSYTVNSFNNQEWDSSQSQNFMNAANQSAIQGSNIAMEIRRLQIEWETQWE